jgi:hypothetical protein
MKASVQDNNTFSPFELKILIENEDEAQRIYSLFQTPSVVKAYGLTDIASYMRHLIEKRITIDGNVCRNCVESLRYTLNS